MEDHEIVGTWCDTSMSMGLWVALQTVEDVEIPPQRLWSR
jgi:hypothetical protein